MKKLVLIALVAVVAALVAAEADAQRLPAFGTYVSSKTIKPGGVLGVAGYLPDASKIVLGDRSCYFFYGFSYNPTRYKTPFVLPAMALAKVPFQAIVQRGKPTQLYAPLRFQVPRVKLPRGFKLPIWFQAIAVGKTRANKLYLQPSIATHSVLMP